MKLHLPTALFALAVLPAVAFAEDIVDNNKDSYHNITPDNLQGFIDIDVPDIESSVDWSDCHPGTGADSSCPYKDAVVHPISERVAKIVIPDTSTGEAGTLVLKNGDTISADNNSKVLYVDGNVSLESGAKVTQTGNDAGGSGQMFKPGMIAKNVSVSEGASMELDAARFDSLTVTGGTVTLRGTKAAHGGGSLHGSGSETSGFGISGAFEFSNAHIAGDLNVQGGTVTIGRDTASTSSLNRVSYISSTYYQGVIGGTIKQSGGTLYIKGMTYLNDGQIEQTGGTMQIANKTNAYAAYLRVGSDTMTVNQAGDASTVLNLNGIIVNGSTGQGNMQLLINQSGEGTINMSTLENRVEVNKLTTAKGYKGSYFTSEPGKESLISQSGSGTIKIDSDYMSATFNVEQTGKGGNITIGATGKLESSALTLTDAATFSVANGGLLKLKDATLSYTVTNFDNTTSIDSITSTAGAAVYNEGPVVSMIDNAGSVSGTIVSVGVALSDEAFAAYTINVGALDENTPLVSFTVTLATGLTQGAVTFNPDEVGITTEASYTVGGESVTVAYKVENVSINGDGNLVATVGARVTAVGGSTPAVPEPATATLSLLALAGLCARRRRK